MRTQHQETMTRVRSLAAGIWDEEKHVVLKGPLVVETESETESDESRGVWGDLTEVKELWKLNDMQMEDLKELGRRVSDIKHRKNTPEDVVRFYLAAGCHLRSAESRFRNMIRWRSDNKVDSMLQNYRPPQEMIDNVPGAILDGCDREGDPIFVDRAASADMLGLIDRFGADEVVKHAIWLRESLVEGDWIQEFEQRHGRRVKQIMIISDMDGLNWNNHANRKVLGTFNRIMRLDQDNYPEAAKCIMTVRTPSIFRAVWALVKHFFDPHVAAKMRFYGYSNYKEELAKVVDLKNLPNVLVEEGEGIAFPGMPAGFVGGKLRYIRSK